MEKIWTFSENKKQSEELIFVFELFKKYADRVEIDTNGEYKGFVEYKDGNIIFLISDKLNYKKVKLYNYCNGFSFLLSSNIDNSSRSLWNISRLESFLIEDIKSEKTNNFLTKQFSGINLKKQTISELAVEMIYQITGETISVNDRDELQGDANYQIAMCYLKKSREI
jgi:hypothetical protein